MNLVIERTQTLGRLLTLTCVLAVLALPLPLGAQVATPAPTQHDEHTRPPWPRPLSAYADGSVACIVIHDATTRQYYIHNLAQCEERLAPCSTFKVPNALVGLESGVLAGPGDVKRWDGTAHSRQVLNQDHDLASAMRHSVVWYFQEVALDVGAERMQAALDAWGYGNRDISGGQDRFWLSSSLRISALEQVRFMSELARDELPASPLNQAVVRALIRQTEDVPAGFRGELYGKTGSCAGPKGDYGWFTGFLERDGQTRAFAVNVKGEGQWGAEARRIAIEVLREMQ
jgi:beta-lactamase class D